MMSLVGLFLLVAALYFWWMWRRENASRCGVPKPRQRRRQQEGPRLSASARNLALVPASSSLQRLNETFEVFDDSFERRFSPIERPLEMAVVPYSAFPTTHNVFNETYVIENAADRDGPLGDPKLNYFFAPFTKEDVFNSTFSVDGENKSSKVEPWWDGEISICDCTACIFRVGPNTQDSSESDLSETSSSEDSYTSGSEDSDTSGTEDPCLGIRLAPVRRPMGGADFNPSWLKPTKTSIMREALAQKRKEAERSAAKKGNKWR